MSRFQPPPFRSLRDLVLKELQRDKSVLVWDDDWSFADDLLAGVLESEAYVLDRPAQDYLARLSSDLTKEDYYRATANIRLPFPSMWIETVVKEEPDEGFVGPLSDNSIGALVRETEDGVEVMTAYALHDDRPWTTVYSGTQVLFRRDGEVICTKTPISRLYDRMAEAEGYDLEAMLNADVDKALRLDGDSGSATRRGAAGGA